MNSIQTPVEVSAYAQQVFPEIKAVKIKGDASAYECHTIFTLGNLIVERWIDPLILDTEVLFSCIMAVNGISKMYPLLHDAIIAKNKLQVCASWRKPEVIILEATGRFEGTYELRCGIWVSHIPIPLANKLRIFPT